MASTLPSYVAESHLLANRPLGQILLENGTVAPEDLVKALAVQSRDFLPLADVLLANGMVTQSHLMQALAEQWSAALIDAARAPPDPRLIDRLGVRYCLRAGVLPWRRVGGAAVIATTRPDEFEAQRPLLTLAFGPVLMALIAEPDLRAALVDLRGSALSQVAENTVRQAESCRGWNAPLVARRAAAVAATLGGPALFWPEIVFAVLFGWAVVMLLATTGIRTAAACAQLAALWRCDTVHLPAPAFPDSTRLPVVSVLVPLLDEKNIATRLVQRLGRLDYPRELLDVLLVVEQEDRHTRAALSVESLPEWMRVIVVPAGRLRTKPRALNFALNFCRGTIVGVYDAEDAPDHDQLRRIVRRFQECGPQVACLQGVLDVYNARTNWLTRCFAIEYAVWFRIVLPGMERLGLPIPLGGTTLFFRRAVLEKLGGWDAHNVTEDADLGIRLARHGYRCELVQTVTHEEACHQTVAWVRQRSRWLKGYAMTYAVHMRDPVLLWRQLGTWQFFGVQVLFVGTLSEFMLAPLIWSFWPAAIGLWHPLNTVLPPPVLAGLGALFLGAWAVNVAVAVAALSEEHLRNLRGWVLTLTFYFPLASLAACKAGHELWSRPFFWDKTAHGQDQTWQQADEPLTT